MSGQQMELAPPIPPPSRRNKEKLTFDLSSPSLALIFYNLILGIPFSYLVAVANKKIFQLLGYEKIIRCPSGILGTKILFVVVNVVLIWFWARQIGEEVSRERVEALRGEVKWWDTEIERLEGVLAESRLRSSKKTGQAGSDADADEQLKEEALLAVLDQNKDTVLIYERDSFINAQGVREWDFVVGAKSPKGKSLGNGGSGIKGLMQSKLPKLKKKVLVEKEE